MSRIRCYFLEPTDQVETELRRYVGNEKGNPCPAPTNWGYHNADVVIGRGPAAGCPQLHDGAPVSGDVWPRDFCKTLSRVDAICRAIVQRAARRVD